jgi:hypothetical protein
MIGAFLAISLFLAQAAPAASNPAAPAASGAKPASDVGTKVSRDQLLCKTEKVMGSLIPKKICYTREEQEQREQEDRKAVERMQSQFGTQCPPQCG